MNDRSDLQSERKHSTLGVMLLRLLIQRLILPTFVLIVLTMGVGSYIWDRSLAAQQMELARVLANTVETFLQNAENMLRSAAKVAESTGDKRFSFYLQASREGFAYFDTIYRLDYKGIIIHLEPNEPRYMGLDQSRQPFYRNTQTKKGLFISKPFNSMRTGKPTVNMSWPLADGGMIVAELNLGTFQDAVTAAHHKQGKSNIIIVDQAGTILANPKTELIAQQARIVDLPLLQKVGSGETTMHYRSNNQRMLGSSTRIESTGWAVLVHAPLSVVYGERVKAAVPIIILCLGIWLFVVMTFRQKFRQHVVTPLSELSKTAIAISSGDLERSASVVSEDEIGIMAKAFNDMTAQLRSVISRQEDRVEQLKNAERISHLGHWDWDMVSDKLAWSDEMIRILGFCPGSVEPSYELLKEVSMDVAALEKHVANALTGLDDFQYENKIKRPDGTIVYVQNHGEVTFDKSGRPIRFFGTSLDITDRKNAQIALQEAHDELEDKILARTAELSAAKQQAETAKERAETANRAKNIFLANMSHELRTPLNAILGYAQIFLRRSPERELAKGLNTIQESGEHLLTLINDILDTAKIEAGKVELSPEPVRLGTFLETIMGIVRSRAEAKGLVVRLETPAALPLAILSDAVRLRQVLLNLLNNAVKFTDKGDVTLCVTCKDTVLPSDAEPLTAGVRLGFKVKDTGIGIPPGQRHRIFSPFEQTSDPERRTDGTGLGLFISRQLVALMGGELEVMSEPGKGSTFGFEIVVPEAQITMEPAAADNRLITGYHGPRRLVLVVDDIGSNRSILADMLKEVGFDVAEAANGRQAITLVQKNPPDVILMDRYMPELDGLSAIQKIRRMDQPNPLLAIAISASVSEEDRSHILQMGFDGFIPKPVRWLHLAKLLEDHMNLEWQYATEDELDEVDSIATKDLISPPVEELMLLQEMVMIGDMEAILSHAARIERMDVKYISFTKRLRHLAKEFEDGQIRLLLEQCMDSVK